MKTFRTIVGNEFIFVSPQEARNSTGKLAQVHYFDRAANLLLIDLASVDQEILCMSEFLNLQNFARSIESFDPDHYAAYLTADSDIPSAISKERLTAWIYTVCGEDLGWVEQEGDFLILHYYLRSDFDENAEARAYTFKSLVF